MTRSIRIALFLLLNLSAILSFSQTSSVSPYSRFGPGDMLFTGFSQQRAMGGTGIAEAQTARLNVFDPASYG